ncbi:hypothetical protein MASR1M48_16530 [Lactococcus petauri]
MNDMVAADERGVVSEYSNSSMTQTNDSARQIAEVQAQVIMAKKFPRDENAAIIRIKRACERKSLAETAQYAYPKGGQMVTGPSIRLAEVIAQNWGNVDYGLKELSNDGQWAEAVAYAWDLETNTMVRKQFRVKLERVTKKGTTRLTDPRDIYEHVANFGMRRVRACILGIIPGDVVEDAEAVCAKALSSSEEPIQDRIKKLLYAFDKIGVSKDAIEKRLSFKVESMMSSHILEYGRIFNSIKDGISKREDWFEVSATSASAASNDITEKLKAKKGAENGTSESKEGTVNE